MLNDSMFRQPDTACDDRRRSDRVPFPSEMVMLWHHDPGTSVRYRVLDVADSPTLGVGGMRIRSALPLLEGMTGMALKLLPQGEAIDRAVMVCWSRPSDEGGFDVGLRFF